MATDTTVADETWRQLGARRFAVMTGAKHPTATDDATLRFSLPGGGGYTRKGINLVEIRLDPSDTYTIKFLRMRRPRGQFIPEITEIESCSDVYNDNLREVFERVTGLLTSL